MLTQQHFKHPFPQIVTAVQLHHYGHGVVIVVHHCDKLLCETRPDDLTDVDTELSTFLPAVRCARHKTEQEEVKSA